MKTKKYTALFFRAPLTVDSLMKLWKVKRKLKMRSHHRIVLADIFFQLLLNVKLNKEINYEFCTGKR